MKAAYPEFTEETKFKHREWHIIPSEDNPNYFNLKTKTGTVVCTLTFPESCDTTLLNLIAAAPELQDIAEMYRDAMVGNQAEKSMVFAIVTEILNRVQ